MIWHVTDRVKTNAGEVAAGAGGDGAPLVLAHGWPWSSYSWHRVIPTLAMQYRVYWYDMPGYGQSEKNSDQRTSLDVQAEIFGEMLTYWNLDRPAVVAHDVGGATTLRAHLLHGCEYSAFMLMNVVAMRPWGSDFFDHVGKHIDAFYGLPNHIHSAVVEAYIKGALVNSIEPDDIDKLVAPWLSDAGTSSFYRQFAQADERFTAEVETMYSKIRCPVAIIWGEDDPWIPLQRGRLLHSLVPKASFDTLKGVGHLPQLESPMRVAHLILDFLKAQ